MITVVANDVEFACLEEGSGPLALCMHGFPDTAHTWRHLMPQLAAQGFRAVAPFQRGYAPTSVPADGCYQSGALLADINALHEALGGSPDSVLIGHDWGAVAAYGAVALEPHRWRKLVTLAVPPAAVVNSDFEQMKRSFYMFLFQTPIAERVVAADDLAFLDHLWHEWSPSYDASADLAFAKESLRPKGRLSAALAYYRTLFDPSTHSPRYRKAQSALMRTAPVPTLYLHGDQDGCLPPPDAATLARQLAEGSSYVTLPGVGHFPQLEAPDLVGKLVLEWAT